MHDLHEGILSAFASHADLARRAMRFEKGFGREGLRLKPRDRPWAERLKAGERVCGYCHETYAVSRVEVRNGKGLAYCGVRCNALAAQLHSAEARAQRKSEREAAEEAQSSAAQRLLEEARAAVDVATSKEAAAAAVRAELEAELRAGVKYRKRRAA